MNIKSKICITMLFVTILILVVVNASTNMKLDKQIEAGELLRTEIEKSMITKGELVDYVTNVSVVINEYQKYRNEVLDSVSNFQFPVLIYGYPENECGMCINKDLKQLYQIQETMGKEHVCIIPTFSENRNNEMRLKNELSSFNYKNIYKMSHITHRYYALINNNGNIEMVFIPEVDMPDLSEAYFDTIKNRISTKEANIQ